MSYIVVQHKQYTVQSMTVAISMIALAVLLQYETLLEGSFCHRLLAIYGSALNLQRTHRSGRGGEQP